MEGEFFFGGLNSFFPDRIVLNPFRPPVRITDFKLFNQPVATGSKLLPQSIDRTSRITLDHKQSVLGFSFAGLSSQLSRKNRYRYKPEGASTGVVATIA